MSTEIERIAAATAILAQHGVPTDVQELLLRGDGRGSVPPGVLANILATARADGRREGMEMAAAWHDLQVETLQAFVPASSQIERDIEIHRDAATAIRAMMEKEGKS